MGFNTVKSLTDKVREFVKAGGDNIATDIEGSLKGIERDVKGLDEDLKLANREAKTRKDKVRELEGEATTKDSKIETLEAKITEENPDVAELENLKKFKVKTIKAQRQSFVDIFGTIVKHANFEKAKPFLVLPESDEKKEYDFKDISDDDMEKNVVELQKMIALGTFGEVKDKQKAHGSNRVGEQIPIKGKLADIQERLNTGKINADQAQREIATLSEPPATT